MDFPIDLPIQLRAHLRALRKARGLTQAALGAQLGVGQARIAEIEGNPGAVSLDQLMRLLQALQVSVLLRDEVSVGGPAARTPRKAKPGSGLASATGRDYLIRPRKGSW